MLEHKPTGNQRYKPKTSAFGRTRFILELEVVVTGETIIDHDYDHGGSIEVELPPRTIWREATLEDFSLPVQNPIPTQTKVQGWTALPDEVIKFLMGCGEINGKSFGERHEVLPGSYWWRNEIRKYIGDLSILNGETSNGDGPI